MKRILGVFIRIICSILCLAMAAVLLLYFAVGSRRVVGSQQEFTASYEIGKRFNQFVTNSASDALDGVLSIEKTYWLNDSDLIAPEPNQDCYGSSADPAELQAVIDGAAELLDGQELLFSTDTPLYKDTEVSYYYDPTILSLTWKQKIDNTIYCISEVKIADASQLRWFMSDGEYLSGSRYLTTEMSATVNAVVACNGVYYAKRTFGIVVNNGQLLRGEGQYLDTCMIDKNGDMIFVERAELTDTQDMQQYIEENGIRFSLSFGPILVENGEMCNIKTEYAEGEAKIPNARAALCQMDSLHYLLVIASIEPPYEKGVVLTQFAETLEELGCDMAYNLDGGRSATLVTNDTLQNFIYERLISDIVYFATAIPNGE